MNYTPKYKLKGCFIAGGALLSHVMKTPVNDIDIYPKSEEGFIDAVSYLCDSERGYIMGASRFSVSIKMPDVDPLTGNRIVCQVVYHDKWYRKAKDVFKHFDLTCCMIAYDCDKEKIYTGDTFWLDVASRTIKINPEMNYPMKTAFRINKYVEKGFSISKVEYMKLMLVLSKRGFPEDWDEFKSQIGGVYGNYIELNIGDLEYNFENALKVISEVNLDDNSYKLNEEDLPCHNMYWEKFLALNCDSTKWTFLEKRVDFELDGGYGGDFSFRELSKEEFLKLVDKHYKPIQKEGRLKQGFKWFNSEGGRLTSVLAPNGKAKSYKPFEVSSDDTPYGLYLCPDWSSSVRKYNNSGRNSDWVLYSVFYDSNDVLYSSSEEIRVKRLVVSNHIKNEEGYNNTFDRFKSGLILGTDDTSEELSKEDYIKNITEEYYPDKSDSLGSLFDND